MCADVFEMSLCQEEAARRHGRILIAALAGALTVVACTVDTLGPLATSIEASPAEKLVAPRDTFRIVVQARGSGGQPIARPGTAFRSTAPPVARVDERGLVTAVAPGAAQIVVETAYAADTVRVSVQ
jgi:hypothetical protein